MDDNELSKLKDAIADIENILERTHITEAKFEKFCDALNDIISYRNLINEFEFVDPQYFSELIETLSSTYEKVDDDQVFYTRSQEKIGRCHDALYVLKKCYNAAIDSSAQSERDAVRINMDDSLKTTDNNGSPLQGYPNTTDVLKSLNPANEESAEDLGSKLHIETSGPSIKYTANQHPGGLTEVQQRDGAVSSADKTNVTEDLGEQGISSEGDVNLQQNEVSLQELILENYRLKAKLKENTDTAARLTATTSQLKSNVEANVTLNSELALKNAANVRYKQLLESADAQLKLKENHIKQLRHDLALQISNSRRVTDAFNKVSETSVLQNIAITNLSNNMRVQEIAKAAMHHRLADTEAKLKQSEENLKQSTERYEQIKETLKTTEDELRSKSNLLLVKVGELNACNRSLGHHQEECRKLRNHLESTCKTNEEITNKLQTDISTKTIELNNLQLQLEEANASDADFEREVTNLKQELAREKSARDSVESEKNMLWDKITATISNCKTAEKKIRQLKVTLSDKRQQINDLKEKLGSEEDRNRQLEKQLSETQEKYKLLRADMIETEHEISLCKRQLDEKKEQLIWRYSKYVEEFWARKNLQENFHNYVIKKNEIFETFKSFIDEHFQEKVENYEYYSLYKFKQIKAQLTECGKDIEMFSGDRKIYLNILEMLRRTIDEINKIRAQDQTDFGNKKEELIQYCKVLEGEIQRKMR